MNNERDLSHFSDDLQPNHMYHRIDENFNRIKPIKPGFGACPKSALPNAIYQYIILPHVKVTTDNLTVRPSRLMKNAIALAELMD